MEMKYVCRAFDFIIMQNENFPSLRADGSIANRVPYGYLVSYPDEPIAVPDGTEVIVVPELVFAEYRRMASGALAVHLVNYDPAHPIQGARIIPQPGRTATAEAPFESDASVHRLPADGTLPQFAEYLLVTVE